MKLKLSRGIVFPGVGKFPAGRSIDKDTVGEIIGLVWNDSGQIEDVEMVFYGHPNSYTVRANDLEYL